MKYNTLKINSLALNFFILAAATALVLPGLRAQVSEGGQPISWTLSAGLRPEAEKAALEAARVLLSPPDIAKLLQRDIDEGLQNRFAEALPLELHLQNAGFWMTLPNGDRLWRLHLIAPGAQSLRPLFEVFHLPPGAKLFAYTPSRSILRGAFMQKNHLYTGRFAINPLPGDALILEYYEPASVAGQGNISLFRLDYGYKAPSSEEKKPGQARFGDAGACNTNINCPLGNDWQDEKRGVVKIILTTANGADWCTGSLINNTAQDQRPLLLSANHCLDGFSSSFTDIWGFIFNYEAATCANPSSEPSQEQSIVGATLLAQYSFSDFALMELSEDVPADFAPYFNGWDRSDNLPAQTFCIHHPEGDIKKISVDRQPPQRTAYTQGNGSGTSHYRVVWDENTTTEPASSGSPLFTPAGDIVGQLHGGVASCSNLNGADWYGRVAISWEGGGSTGNALKTWLDPLNTGLTRLSGRDFNRNDPPPAPTARLLADALEIFPNPAQDQIWLRQVNPGFANQELVCILYNLQGQKIGKWVLDTDQLQAPGQAEISLSFLGRGLYWLQFETPQENFGLKLMIE
ncbi:MAG: hypothetical protein OHK0053_18010 [Microscillaceae bacterium]